MFGRQSSRSAEEHATQNPSGTPKVMNQSYGLSKPILLIKGILIMLKYNSETQTVHSHLTEFSGLDSPSFITHYQPIRRLHNQCNIKKAEDCTEICIHL